MNWSGNFREGLAREIRENKTLAKITAYVFTVTSMGFSVMLWGAEKLVPVEYWYPYGTFV